MREHPRCPAEVRLGLAACHFRLGHFDRARAAYERTLQLNPDCCEALLGLAVLSFNAPDADKCVTFQQPEHGRSHHTAAGYKGLGIGMKHSPN